MTPLDAAPRARDTEAAGGVAGSAGAWRSRTAEPTDLRRSARQARHLGVPTIADALDAAAERIALLEAMVRDAVPHVERAPEERHGRGTGRMQWLHDAREMLPQEHIMADTLRGIPIDHTWAWIVVILRHDGEVWMPLPGTVARTRSEAIRKYEDISTFPGSYARARTAGRALALECMVQPCASGEDARAALREVGR